MRVRSRPERPSSPCCAELVTGSAMGVGSRSANSSSSCSSPPSPSPPSRLRCPSRANAMNRGVADVFTATSSAPSTRGQPGPVESCSRVSSRALPACSAAGAGALLMAPVKPAQRSSVRSHKCGDELGSSSGPRRRLTSSITPARNSARATGRAREPSIPRPSGALRARRGCRRAGDAHRGSTRVTEILCKPTGKTTRCRETGVGQA